MKIQVAVALPGRQEVLELVLGEGATVAEALAAARLAERFPGLDLAKAALGIWSRACTPDARLRDGDRVEVYRPLAADAKAQRRARARLKPSSPRSRSGP
ncbi:MAG TPA: RnfH family protein [Usitatibacter sp.]|nr:RnfH family protein [Usitatibacter sp.]